MKGKDRFLRKLRFYASREFDELAGSIMHEAADAVSAEAQNSITRGAVSGRNHIPSAPGQSPNEDTGFLRSKISAARTGLLSAEVRADAPYSAPLEFGTSKMAARPYLRPARDKEAAGAIEKGLRKMNAQIRRKTRGS